MRARAYAKVNLALAVYPRMADGYHPISGLFQSVSLCDDLAITPGSRDAVTVTNDEAPSDTSNLAWKAFDAARRSARVTQPAALHITKRIPAGAGLGGGSADAAAALGLAAHRFGVDDDHVAEIAESLGADVPFSLVGGSSLVEGRGERLTPLQPYASFAFAVVVPPFALSTPTVFRRWDELGGPVGKPVQDQDLPPALRGGPPIRNDLVPAAISIDSRVGEWIDLLERRWSTPVVMTGSGSAMFGLFATVDEAEGAAAAIELPTRHAAAAVPVSRGWEPIDD